MSGLIENSVVDSSPCFVSIQLNSNRPQQIQKFLQNVERTASRPEAVEVLIHIDKGDSAMEQVLDGMHKQLRLQVKYLATDIVKSFFDLWKPLNELIKLTDPAAYFVINVSDEFLFETQGWDDRLRQYVGYYPDHIFRVRASQYRYRNYRDVWECGFAPDSLAFYTKRWLDIVGDWNPCLGPDSFQQCVAYYLCSFDQFNIRQCNRDIPDPFIQFTGEGANIGLEGEALKKRSHGHIKEWFVLMSAEIQQEAKRRAMLLRAHIFAEEQSIGHCAISDHPQQKCIELRESLINRSHRFSYRVNRLGILMTNNLRKLRYHYYSGGGNEAAIETLFGGCIFYLSYKSAFFDRLYRQFERSWIGKSLVQFKYSKKMKRNLRELHESLARSNADYYLYGTGEYSLNILTFIERMKLAKPKALLEKQSILAAGKDLSAFSPYSVMPDAEKIAELTAEDVIVIGSFCYVDEIISRLRAAGCPARLINLKY
ncbi:MAG: hypothetical protein JXR59_01875 [Desulfuromonadaceae bacterium]|nr:hypothetical protein [Desulfuromonadaceae bacterium]